MAQRNAIEAKARKEYRSSAKNGANPIKEKTLNKKLLALYPDNEAEIPDLVARIISEEAATRQQLASPEPAVVNSGGVPLTVDSTPNPTPELAPTPETTQPPAKQTKTAARKAKRAEKALQQIQQQEEDEQTQISTPIFTPAESSAPGPEASENPVTLSKGAAKRAKKAEKLLQKLQQQEEPQQAQTPNTAITPSESPTPGPEISQSPALPSKNVAKKAKKAEKAMQKLQQAQEEAQQAQATASTPVTEPWSAAESASSQNPVKLSKSEKMRAKKAEKALERLQKEEAEAQQASAPAPGPSKKAKSAKGNAAPSTLQESTVTLTWGDPDPLMDSSPATPATPAAPENTEKVKPKKEKKDKKDKGNKDKKEKKEKKGKKQQQTQQISSMFENGKISQNGDVLDWAEDHDTTTEIIREAPANSKVEELRAYIGAPNGKGHKSSKASISKTSVLDRQLELLGLDDMTVESETHATNDTQEAVLFSADLLDRAPQRVAPQYALLGSSAPNPDSAIDRSSRRMFLNTNIPFSAFICGVQGSGKSHTTSCLIENCMIQSSSLGVLKKPLSTLVLHLGEHSSSLNLRPSEAAFLSSPGRGMLDDYSQVSVTVLASPSNYPNLRALYSQMPNVEVRPFMLQPRHLNVGTMMALMSVDTTQNAPLYMGQVTKILREMASKSTGEFDYLDFRRRLENSNLDGRQVEFLNQRLDLLESFLDLKGKVKEPNFEAGKVTIIDLSCPFVDSNTACVLFNIGLGMFLQSDPSTGKVIVVDEAHKYMTDTPAAKQLTETLLAIIRQQRHYGVRVIISTQEPTITPRLIDLCSVTVIHRFFSPEWFNALRKHIAPARSSSRSRNRGRSRPQSNGNGVEGGESDENSWDSGDGDDETAMELFRNISGLGTGEAIVFAPSAILGIGESGKARKAEKLFKMKMRKRVTWDGGKSMVCV